MNCSISLSSSLWKTVELGLESHQIYRLLWEDPTSLILNLALKSKIYLYSDLFHPLIKFSRKKYKFFTVTTYSDLSTTQRHKLQQSPIYMLTYYIWKKILSWQNKSQILKLYYQKRNADKNPSEIYIFLQKCLRFILRKKSYKTQNAL